MTSDDPRSYDGPEPAGVDVKPVFPGYEYTVRNGDGTATKGWAPTREKALERAQEVDS